LTNENGSGLLLVGTENGKVLFFNSFLYPVLIDSFQINETEIVKQIAANENYIAVISDQEF